MTVAQARQLEASQPQDTPNAKDTAKRIQLRYKLAPYGEAMLGQGGGSVVYKATEQGSGDHVAIKKSRVSKKVRRGALQHEARILQLLQGHPAIPAVYGYGRIPHFECMAMELLGESLGEKMERGISLGLKTVVRFVDQALAALQHIHSLGIVHRDIKPENFLCALGNPSRIKIIDFGISKPFYKGPNPPSQYSPLKERRQIVGTVYWASLNSHHGLDLSPRDDLESLAYIAIFMIQGNLPWKPRPRLESLVRSQEVVRILKLRYTSIEQENSDLLLLSPQNGIPNEIVELLRHSRSLRFGEIPDYGTLRKSFKDLGGRLGIDSSISDEALDWSPQDAHASAAVTVEEPEVDVPEEDDEDDDDGDSDDLGDDSYRGWDIDIWERQGDRDQDLTLPVEKEEEIDAAMPVIVEIQE